MSNLLLIDASVLFKTWAVAFLGFHINGMIHVLPAIALTALLIRHLYNKTMIQY